MQGMELGDQDVESKGEHLLGLRIDLIVAGGVASVESPKLIRELRRFGADVRVTMTPAATKFLTPLSLEWASKAAVVTELSGSAEHISRADLVLVAPATLDFIGKASHGLADSAALALLQSVLGRRPVIFVPSMHDSLARNPLFQKNKARLSECSHVYFLDPVREEGKNKSPSVEAIVAQVCHWAGQASPLRGVNVALSLGPTRSLIDDVRFLSNRSTGSLGRDIADELFRRGARVVSVAGPLQVPWPSYLEKIDVETNADMKNAFRKVVSTQKPKALIFAAAVLDFDVDQPRSGKSSSKTGLRIDLKPSPKLIQAYRTSKAIKVGFKLESRVSESELIARAQRALAENRADVVVANRLEDVKPSSHRAVIISRKGAPVVSKTRSEIARHICDAIESRL